MASSLGLYNLQNPDAGLSGFVILQATSIVIFGS